MCHVQCQLKLEYRKIWQSSWSSWSSWSLRMLKMSSSCPIKFLSDAHGSIRILMRSCCFPIDQSRSTSSWTVLYILDILSEISKLESCPAIMYRVMHGVKVFSFYLLQWLLICCLKKPDSTRTTVLVLVLIQNLRGHYAFRILNKLTKWMFDYI